MYQRTCLKLTFSSYFFLRSYIVDGDLKHGSRVIKHEPSDKWSFSSPGKKGLHALVWCVREVLIKIQSVRMINKTSRDLFFLSDRVFVSETYISFKLFQYSCIEYKTLQGSYSDYVKHESVLSQKSSFLWYLLLLLRPSYCTDLHTVPFWGGFEVPKDKII